MKYNFRLFLKNNLVHAGLLFQAKECMIHRRFSLLLPFVLASGCVYAQKDYSISDYVITVKGDSLVGTVKVVAYDLGKPDKVEVIVQKKKTMYSATQVRTIHVNKEIYVSIPMAGSYQFMKPLKEGYLSLYAFRQPNTSLYDGRYLVKSDGSSLEVPNLLFKKSMGNFLSDCSGVKELIRTGDLGKKEIEKIIDQYNACIAYNTKAKMKEPAAYRPVSNPKSVSVENLRKKVEGLADFPDKKNTLDLLNDISGKVTNSQPVPDYLLNALNGYIGANAQVKEELQKFIEELKKN